MFRGNISSTPLHSESARWFYSELVSAGKATNIDYNVAYSACGDCTMQSTLMALLMDKGGTDLTSTLLVGDAPESSWCCDNGIGLYGRSLRRFQRRDRSLYFINVPKDELNISSLIDLSQHVAEYAEEICPDSPGTKWEYQPAINQFFGSKFPVFCFINSEKAVSVVYVVGLTTQKWHWLQCALPAIIPWFFRNESGKLVIDGIDKEITNALTNSDRSVYLDILQRIADEKDFENLYRSSKLRDFEVALHSQEIENLKERIRDIEATIDNYFDAISNSLVDKRDKMIKLTGLQATLAKNENTGELADFFDANSKVLSLVRVEDSMLTFRVRAAFDIYDSSAVETMLENEYSVLHTTRCGISNEDLCRFVKAVFVDETLRLRTCATYYIDIRRMRADGLGQQTYDGYDFETYLPNPHIQHYTCTGNYREQAVMAMRNGNYLGAITQFIASAKCINFHDSVVIQRFLTDDIANNHSTLKCVELPNGEIVTIDEAIEYLKNN